MWLKLVLLIIYVSVLFILARVLETITWVESGNFSRRLLDPMTLSVLKLKALLEQRGISYEGAVEKRELTELVEGSGTVTEEAVKEAALEENVEVTNFTGGAHFLEQVEDCKDSVWLVHVREPGSHVSSLADTSWYTLRRKLSRFGVNAGVFDCKLDAQFCLNKGWHSSKLILGLPQDFRRQGVVTLYSYSGSYKLQNIFNWIRRVVSTKVYPIPTFSQFQKNWVTYEDRVSSAEVRLVLFSQMDMTPLFFSALSVKFPGRVRFGKFRVNDSMQKKSVLRMLKTDRLPMYVVITSERTYIYGYNSEEHFTFKSMETFLKMLYPSLNDIFVLSLMVCNLISIFELFIKQGSWLKRFMCLILCVVKYNMILLLVWISLLTLFQLSIFNFLIELGLKLIRILAGSTVGVYLLRDTKFYLNHVYLTEISFIVYLLIVGYLAYKYKYQLADDSNPNEWNFAQFRTLQHLFYPTASIAAGIYQSRYRDLEESRESLRLFHSSQIREDYIHMLPTWPYKNLTPITRLGPVYPPVQDFTENSDRTNPSEFESRSADNKNQIMENNTSNKISPCGNVSYPDTDKNVNVIGDPLETLQKVIHDKTSGTIDDSSEDAGVNKVNAAVGRCDEAPEGVLLDTQCVICLDEYEAGVLLCGLPCGHCFHKKCLLSWLTRDNHFCPVCRRPSDQPKSVIHLHSE